MPYQRHRMGIRQKRVLLDMVEDTFYFTKGKHAAVRGDLDKQSCWRIIAGKLNKMGPIRKDPNSWQKAWCSMKCKVRDKYKKLHKITVEQQNGDLELDRITEEDWRVIKMCSITTNKLNKTTSTTKPTTIENDIIFVDSDVIIKSPPTTDEEEDVIIPFAEPGLSTVLPAQQLSELLVIQKPVLKQPIAMHPLSGRQTSVNNRSSNTAMAKNSNSSKPTKPDVSKQLEVIVKSLQMHTNMQRHMLFKMQKSNELQRIMIDILGDIKTHLPV